MPSLAIWKKDSSGCSFSLWRTAECREIGRDVSLFHLVAWVHPCLVVLFVCGWFWRFCFVGWFFDCTQVFRMAFAKGQLGLLLTLDHRRLDDRQSLGARTAAAQKKKSGGQSPSSG